MKESHKELYEAPTTEVVEVKTENGVLTASSEQYETTQW